MPIQTDSLNRKLYDLLDSRGYNPTPMDADVSKAGKIVAPEEADVFKFTFKRGEESIDDALVSIDGANKLTLYYDENLSKEGSLKTADTDIDDSWFGFLKFLKKWAFSKRLSWELAPKQKINSDMAQRTYMRKKEQIAEGYYPMGNKASYSDAIPTVKIVLQHTRQIQEGEQRYRNVARIFLENTHGERILAPTTKPGIAQIYARHLAEGGVPNDERWNHIKSLCEEYGKMAGFVRAVRGNQFNESAQRLVEAGLNHYTNLRESLSKMRGHRGYNAYFESWTPTLMETEGDETNLNELFVEETLDPRIESVMPILSKLSKNISEVKEVKELEEWADNLLEAPGAETLAHNQATEKSRLNAFDLDEDEIDDAEAAKKKMNIPAYQRKAQGGDWKVTQKDLDKIPAGTRTTSQGLAAHAKRIGLEEEDVEESGLQAYLGNKKYGKAGMDALRKAGRDGASKGTMANIRAKYDKLDEEGVAEGSEDYQEIFQMNTKQGKVGAVVQYKDKSFGFIYGTQLDPRKFDRAREAQQALNAHHNKQGVAEGFMDNIRVAIGLGRKNTMAPGYIPGHKGRGPYDNPHGLPYFDKQKFFADAGISEQEFNALIPQDQKFIKSNPAFIKLYKSGNIKAYQRAIRQYIDNAKKQYTRPYDASAAMDKYDSSRGYSEGVAEGSDLDAQAMDIATKLTTGKNLEKLRGMAYDSTVYRALDRYFAKHNIPETIYNRVASIVFKRINQQGVAEGRFKQTPGQQKYGALHSQLQSLADSGQINTPAGKQKAEKIIDTIQQLVNTDPSCAGSTVPSKKIWLSEQGVAEGYGALADLEKKFQELLDIYLAKQAAGETTTTQEKAIKLLQSLIQSKNQGVAEDDWGWDDPQYDKREPERDEDWEYERYRQQELDDEDDDAENKDVEEGVAEDLDANQKRAGQLGPTGGPAKVGDLVGANESVDPLKDMLRLLGK